METEEGVKLFRFWLSEGYKFRKRDSLEIQQDPAKYKRRLKMEYDMIVSIPGYVDYFLMVSDLVRWAKDQGILVGPGRGSAASSLCCWLLRITELDPLMYPMLFERFISPDRPDLPDVDIDFEDERRGEVIAYAQQKYGMDRVANILTFTRYKGKNSLDDIARVYNIPKWKIENIKGKLVERADGHPRFAHTLEDTMSEYEDVATLVDSTPALALATKLEGCDGHSNIRTAGVHPCGIVISGVPMTNISAMYEKQSGKDRGSGIAFDKKDSEYLGLLKIDFLSLTTLTGIRATLDALGMSIDEFYRIPLNDPKVFEAFRAGDVLGIFQFEGVATKSVLKAVAPTKFMDLVDVNALSRPGGDDQAYVQAKNSGVLPDINPVAGQHLNWTYGTIVYQEQILLILRDYGNFPAKDVNAVRKIISAKQDQSILNEYFQRFAEGAATHGDTVEEASAVWKQILSATGYAFNISHAACYSDTAYRQMWLKVYHPEFYLGQLLKCPEDKLGLERRRKLIVEAERHNIPVRSVSLLDSQVGWSLRNGKLIAGFTAIHKIGPSIAQNIVNWRDAKPDGTLFQWSDLLEVKGIGQGRVDTIQEFAENKDPFGVMHTKNVLDEIRKDFDNNQFPTVRMPTHNSMEVRQPEEFVTFMGILKNVQYRDAVQQGLKYGGEGVTRESILDGMTDPHLLKYAVLDCEDEFDEPVRIRVSRKKFPDYKGLIGKAEIGVDIIVVSGFVTDFGGLAIQTSELVVINP